MPAAHAKVYKVDSATKLYIALDRVIPGDVISLAAGTYAGNFIINRSGASALVPIRLTGPDNAYIQSNTFNGNRYGLHLQQVRHWTIEGFTVRNAKKGIVLDGSSYNILTNLIVQDTEEEGVHLRTNSTDNIIENSRIYNTGLKAPGYGEGIYIGSAASNWLTYTNGNPDKSDRNQVIGNLIGPNVRAEGVDIKEGTSHGIVRDNVFDGSGISGINAADSVMDVKGNFYLITGNTIVYTPTLISRFLLDGFQVHQALAGWGNNNLFCGNNFDLNNTRNFSLNAIGYGIMIKENTVGNKVSNNNIALHGNGKVTNLAFSACLQ